MHFSTLTIVAIVILLLGAGLLANALLKGGAMLGTLFDRSRAGSGGAAPDQPKP